MELIFPFKNMATNTLLEFVEKDENIRDFILTENNKYPLPENYFLKRVEFCKSRFASFENEILQVINTTNQETIDAYFKELRGNVEYMRELFSLENIEITIAKWNEKSLKIFEETVEKDTDEYFKDEDRKRKHLEEYEVLENNGLLSSILGKIPEIVKKINYNFYSIEKQPEYFDEKQIISYHEFLTDLCKEYMEIAERYIIPYNNGEIKSKVEKSFFNKPVVFVEGEHDITYMVKAAELLGYTELLSRIELRQRGGSSGLDKIWDVYKDNNWETVPQKKLLLYDCDIIKQDDERGYVYRRIIKTIPENIISKGIENLFPNSIIEKSIESKDAFVDITETKRTKRGVKTVETKCIVNTDEKKNLCQWICENGTLEDFINFKIVFDLIKLVE